MKKNKIIGLALGLTSVVGVTAATVVLSSCSNSVSKNELFADDCFGWNDSNNVPNGAKIVRESGTNNWTVYTGLNEEGKGAITDIDRAIGFLKSPLTNEQIKGLGFNPESLENGLLGTHTDCNEEGVKNYSNLKKGNSFVMYNNFYFYEIKENANVEDPDFDIQQNIKKYKTLPFKVTVIVDSYK